MRTLPQPGTPPFFAKTDSPGTRARLITMAAAAGKSGFSGSKESEANVRGLGFTEAHNQKVMRAQIGHARPCFGEGAHGVFGRTWRFNHSCSVTNRRPSPLAVLRENVISALHDGVAGVSALGVVVLRRLVG